MAATLSGDQSPAWDMRTSVCTNTDAHILFHNSHNSYRLTRTSWKSRNLVTWFARLLTCGIRINRLIRKQSWYFKAVPLSGALRHTCVTCFGNRTTKQRFPNCVICQTNWLCDCFGRMDRVPERGGLLLVGASASCLRRSHAKGPALAFCQSQGLATKLKTFCVTNTWTTEKA